MKNIFLGYDLFGESVYWNNLDNFSSVFIGGLSGTGKTYLSHKILQIFYHQQFKTYVISKKVYVDFKQDYINRIQPHTEKDKLTIFISEINTVLEKTKTEVEKSQFSHIKHLKNQPKIFILIDELWSLNDLEKPLKIEFENLCSLIIREGRYLGIYIAFLSQLSAKSETDIPIRQCSIIITGRTDSKQLSESLFSSDFAYSNPALQQQGTFIFWDRLSEPKVIKISEEIKGLKKWILKLLKKI